MEYKIECPFCKIELQPHDCYLFYHHEEKLCCPECGFIKNIGDYYISYPNGSVIKQKKPVFKPNMHFEKKLNQIIGNEIPKNANVLKEVSQYLKENKITNFSIDDLCKILKKLGYSKYYEYTTYFIKKLANVEPPNIPEEILMKANCMFQKIMKTRQRIQLEGKNNPRYLYLIYKIFDVILPPDDNETRRIFQFIRLPSAQTLAKREKEWNIIWKEMHSKKDIKQLLTLI